MIEECGYDTALYISSQYMNLFDEAIEKIITNESEALQYHPDVVWIYNVGVEDLRVIYLFKKCNSKIVYVLHEPYKGFTPLYKEGKSFFRMGVAIILNFLICHYSDRVIVSSRCAMNNCQKYMPMTKRKAILFPLIFPDLFINGLQREYFSLIGSFSEPHGSLNFIKFIRESYKNNKIKFQIATRNDISILLEDDILKEMIQQGRLIVQQGRPLTVEEINKAYRQSICTWNVYNVSNQSGVLVNSLMQGTPVIATKIGSFEEYIDNYNNSMLVKSHEYDELFNAYSFIEQHIDGMSKKCRKTFLDKFFYANQEDKFKKIIEEMTKKEE